RAVRRHPRISVGLVAAAVTALIAGAVATAGCRTDAREWARTLKRTLQMNGFIASGQAGALLFQLRAYSDRVERAARHPAVRALMEADKQIEPAPQLAAVA